ncbi:MAG: VanZ family protein [Bacteroidales bacterium]|nr:VanZ family protein [Bacteroidales bacterium]
MQFFFKNFWPGITWWCFILVLTLAPGNYFPKVGSFWNLFSPDKLIHLFIFGVLAFLLLLGTSKQFRAVKNRYTVVLPLAVTVFTGIITELLQAGLPIGREASIYDVIANFTGCFAGYIIFSFFRNKNRENVLAN